MTGRPSARFGMLAAGLLLAGALSINAATADPTEPDPAPTTTETTTSTTTTTSEPPPAQPDPPTRRAPIAAAQRPEVEVTGVFDKPSYDAADLVKITVGVKNVGTEKAVGLKASSRPSVPTDLRFDPRQWGALSSGVTLEPGATHSVTLSGNVRDLNASVVTLTGNVFDRDGFGVAEFAFSAPVTKTLSRVAGTIYGDRNGNAVFDQGEALPNITITWRYVHNFETKFTAKSDASGRFDFGELPAASYFTGSEVTGGWLIPFRRVEISKSNDNTKQLVRAVPPLNGALSAKMSFTKDSYKPGELAHVTVTLSNSGPIPLTGIVAACNRGGFFDRSLSGRGPGWGDLAGDGVTIPAGQTRKFDVSENVPDGAIHVGRVFVGCDFGYNEVDIENHAQAGDVALVPGGVATLVGDVLFFPEGHGPGKPQQGIAGVKVILVDKRDCPIVGERTTDANGHFEFRNLAPGPDYLVYLLPPQGWKIKGENPTRPDVRGPADPSSRLIIEVEKGDGQNPTVPKQPASCTTTTTTTTAAPAPQARSTSGLASTGASVLWLGGLGLVALLLGTGVLITARRRRAT